MDVDDPSKFPAEARRKTKGVTIRQAFLLWYRFLWVALLAVGVLAGSWRATWDNHVFRAGVLSCLVLSVVGLFAFGMRCPRCQVHLVHKAPDILGRRGQFKCPKCGVSMEDARQDPNNAT
jgi:hypothetical protein